MKRLTTEKFIEKAKKIHGNKYDYSLVDYKNNKTKIRIICSEHGEFWQIPSNHLRDRGCPKCSGNVKLTTEEFIKKAKQVHGNKYDYSLVDYKHNKTKIRIICSEHGEFWQIPNDHLNGSGCPKCGIVKRSKKRLSNTKKFIEKAKKIHGNKYDYSLVDYKNNKTKIRIICSEHGEFWQIPSNHLNKYGCQKCSGNVKLTTEEFIKKAKQVHGNKYDYSLVDYKHNKTKICIICPEHGEFWQKSNSHLNGSGCPKCSGNVKLTTEEFIKKAKQVHGNKYDYSLVNYKDVYTKVRIICPEHGEFWQIPSSHLNGSKCPFCSGKKNVNDYYLWTLYKKKNEKLLGYDVKPKKKYFEQYNKYLEIVSVRCKYCEKWFFPSKQQIYSRFFAQNNINQGANHLYCSEKCKENCPNFKKVKYQFNKKHKNNRPDQGQWAKLVKGDKIRCERCGKNVGNENLIAHHIIPVKIAPLSSLDIDNGSAVCKECHKEIHAKEGCKTGQLANYDFDKKCEK